ncbi:hypothetical protein Tco_0237907 [Tanacetum coccineum]
MIFKAPSMPFTPGVEALGVVIVVIPRLIRRQVGYVVAHGRAPIGAFTEELQKGQRSSVGIKRLFDDPGVTAAKVCVIAAK